VVLIQPTVGTYVGSGIVSLFQTIRAMARWLERDGDEDFLRMVVIIVKSEAGAG
jgi:hypothetical protein